MQYLYRRLLHLNGANATPDMTRLSIQGGVALCGKVHIGGAKNAALPLLAATLLTDMPVRLRNLPTVGDIAIMLELLQCLNKDYQQDKEQRLVTVTAGSSNSHVQNIPPKLATAIRASFLLVGPLLTRFGGAKISLPGGCVIGNRDIDQHLKGFKALGADIDEQDDHVTVSAASGLIGTEITMLMPTVTGTENILLAAVLAKGETVINNAACEPEITDLSVCLNKMGACIEGHGTTRLVIKGVDSLSGVDHRILPDRIESGSYLAAVAATGGQVQLVETDPSLLQSVLSVLIEAGAAISTKHDSITLDMRGRQLQAFNITTSAYPGFPTDLQPQFMVLAAIADGESVIEEAIFDGRLGHIKALQQMGADVTVTQSQRVLLKGPRKLQGAEVAANNLRASFALLIAALAATKGHETLLGGLEQLYRGYECPESKLCALGAKIKVQDA